MGAKSETILHNFSAQKFPNREEQDLIIAATKIAEGVKHTNPTQSNYHVKAVAIGDYGRFATGGNRERSHTHAWIHGETSAINNYVAKYGNAAIKAISFWFPSTDLEDLTAVGPCGPCRDTLKQELNPDTFITEGNDEVIAVKRLSDFLKDEFSPLATKYVNPEAVAEAELALRLAQNQYLPDDMKSEVYGVSLVNKRGQLWRGQLQTTYGYHELSPGYSAVASWWNSQEPAVEISDVERITIARYGALPTNIEYGDRQALIEFDEVLQKRFKRRRPLQVDLVHVNNEGAVVEAARTNTREWLPSPFVLDLPIAKQQAFKLKALERASIWEN